MGARPQRALHLALVDVRPAEVAPKEVSMRIWAVARAVLTSRVVGSIDVVAVGWVIVWSACVGLADPAFAQAYIPFTPILERMPQWFFATVGAGVAAFQLAGLYLVHTPREELGRAIRQWGLVAHACLIGGLAGAYATRGPFIPEAWGYAWLALLCVCGFWRCALIRAGQAQGRSVDS